MSVVANFWPANIFYSTFVVLLYLITVIDHLTMFPRPETGCSKVRTISMHIYHSQCGTMSLPAAFGMTTKGRCFGKVRVSNFAKDIEFVYPQLSFSALSRFLTQR
jgi:hypothetical protein